MTLAADLASRDQAPVNMTLEKSLCLPEFQFLACEMGSVGGSVLLMAFPPPLVTFPALVVISGAWHLHELLYQS